MYVDNANTDKTDTYSVSNFRAGDIKILDGLETTSCMGTNNLFDEEYVANLRINAFGGRYYELASKFNVYAG